MAEIVTRVCDLCGGAGAHSVQICTTEFGDWPIDVCDSCLAPFLAHRPRNHRFRKMTLPPQPL